MDMPEIIDNVFMSATEFMHQSGMRMDADHVGKPQDLCLWCSVDGAKNWGLWVALCGSRPVVPEQSALQRHGIISLFRFLETIIRIAILAPNWLGKSQLLPLEDISRITASGEIPRMWNQVTVSLNFFSFSTPSLPPHRRADGDQGLVWGKASNVAFNIVRASVMCSPVMDALRYDGSRRCYDRSALLGYSSYDSDNDSDKESANAVLHLRGYEEEVRVY